MGSIAHKTEKEAQAAKEAEKKSGKATTGRRRKR
jgi:hypothetical protein